MRVPAHWVLCAASGAATPEPRGVAENLDERFGDPGGPDPGEATSSAASASSMRERAAQELNPEMGRMGAEDPPPAFSAAPLGPKKVAEQHPDDNRHGVGDPREATDDRPHAIAHRVPALPQRDGLLEHQEEGDERNGGGGQ